MELLGRDCHIRHTGKDGTSYVDCHRVWDRDRFVASQQRAAETAGGKARAEEITPEQYARERRK